MTTSTDRDGFIIASEDGTEIGFIACITSGSRRERAFQGLLRQQLGNDTIILDTRDENPE